MIPPAGSMQVQGHLAAQLGWERQQSGISGPRREEKGGRGKEAQKKSNGIQNREIRLS